MKRFEIHVQHTPTDVTKAVTWERSGSFLRSSEKTQPASEASEGKRRIVSRTRQLAVHLWGTKAPISSAPTAAHGYVQRRSVK
ncbi:hypothetical protein BGZ63DRAFT_426775 [Mariannaea sp. PMI_226]|nr:hypothetical protein BGZ63DRAFT_426775 [Mariannaea sp. PMI_226]